MAITVIIRFIGILREIPVPFRHSTRRDRAAVCLLVLIVAFERQRALSVSLKDCKPIEFEVQRQKNQDQLIRRLAALRRMKRLSWRWCRGERDPGLSWLIRSQLRSGLDAYTRQNLCGK
jgi:hypothetical protein